MIVWKKNEINNMLNKKVKRKIPPNQKESFYYLTPGIILVSTSAMISGQPSPS